MRKVVQMVLFTSLTLLLAAVHAAIASEASDKNSYEKIYKKQCATCHGNNGDGKGRAAASFSTAPTDFTSTTSKQRLTADRIKASIRDGVAGTSMVAYGRRFDDKGLNGLADYIQTAFMSRRVSSGISSRGQDIYNDNCSACHGDNGQSAVWAQNGLKPPPRNFTTPKLREKLSRERMITSVTFGRPGTAMMSFSKRLSSTEIEMVVEYIRDNFMMKPQVSSPPAGHGTVAPVAVKPHDIIVDMQATFPDKIVANALSGKRLYESNCVACHGGRGDGKGPRADFNYPRPRNFTTDDSRLIFNRPKLFQSISRGKRGSVMPAWNTVLTKQQIADVAEYVFQQFILNSDIVELNLALKKKS